MKNNIKIISLNENVIDSIFSKDILFPVYWYKIPVQMKENNFNFLEETVYKLKKIEPSLDLLEIAKLLGLENRKDLIKTILEKVDPVIEKGEDEIWYLNFFQESFNKKILPIVAKKIDKFAKIKKKFFDKERNIKIIDFEIDNKNISKAIAPDIFETNPSMPQNRDFIKTILKNNKNKSDSEYVTKININKIYNFKIVSPEPVYLHVRFLIPEYNQEDFLITNGFNSGYSMELKKAMEAYYGNLIEDLMKKGEVDSEIKEKITLPFNFSDFPDIKLLAINIEKEFKGYEEKTSDKKRKSKAKILENCFDIIEKSFENLAKEDIKVENNLFFHILKEYEFEYHEKFNLFNGNKNSIQEYLKKCFILKKDEIKELELFSKKSLFFIEKLLNIRNDLKHSQTPDLDKVDIKKYIDNTYKIVSILLNIKKNKVNMEIKYDEELKYNARNKVKSDFREEYNLLNKYVIEKLEHIYFYLEEIKYENDEFNVSKEVVNSLYSIFEHILKEKINSEIRHNKKIIISKDALINKYNLPKELITVRNKKFDNALKGYSSSLGAVYLVYLGITNNYKMADFISSIIRYRKHGNNFEIIKEEELINLREKSFKFIKELTQE